MFLWSVPIPTVGGIYRYIVYGLSTRYRLVIVLSKNVHGCKGHPRKFGYRVGDVSAVARIK